jgi:hypothetical protein
LTLFAYFWSKLHFICHISMNLTRQQFFNPI